MNLQTDRPARRRISPALALRALGVGLASTFVTTAWAQESAGLEEVVVTATKRSENIQDTPLAVQAFSGEQLVAMGAMDVSDWAPLVPGLAIQDNGPGDKRYVIRGVNSAGSGTVGVYLDDVVITGENSQDGGGQAPDVMLFDMERIEVLKGPQGSTFGSSSLTGTIRFITAKPNLTAFSGAAGAGYSMTTGGGVGNQVDGMVNVPIVSGRFAVRLAGLSMDDPGYINTPFATDANETRVKAGRLSAKLAVTDQITLTALAMVQQTTSGALPYYNAPTAAGAPVDRSGFDQPLYAREAAGNKMNMYDLALDYKASYGTYTLTSSRFYRDVEYLRDSSFALQSFLGLPADGAGRSGINYPKHRHVESDEARFASDWRGPLQLLVGGFYQKEERHFTSEILSADSNGFISADPTVFLRRTQDDTITEKAAFAEVSWAFTDELKLTLGGRRYDISDSQHSNALVGFGGGPGGGPGPALSATNTGQIGKINLSYTPMQNVLAYAQVGEGFRPGGVNDQTAAQIAGVSIPSKFSSDSLVNYELGLKTSWLDNRFVANGAVYFIDWSKIQLAEQATSGTSSFPYTGNGGRATVKGVELELEALPLTGLRLGAFFNYNEAVLAGGIPSPTLGLVGDRIPYVPKTTFTLSSDYEWPLEGTDLKGTVGAQYSYTSSRNSVLQTEPPSGLFQVFPDYANTGIRAGVESDTWSLLVNVANLFNDTSTIAVTPGIPGLYPESPIPNRPRTISIMLRVNL
jgi:outer membrane receptor protein involved in Fe transport